MHHHHPKKKTCHGGDTNTIFSYSDPGHSSHSYSPCCSYWQAANICQENSMAATNFALTVIPVPHDSNLQVIPVTQPTMTSLATATTGQFLTKSTMGDQLAMTQYLALHYIDGHQLYR
jgi:hypothetical protein